MPKQIRQLQKNTVRADRNLLEDQGMHGIATPIGDAIRVDRYVRKNKTTNLVYIFKCKFELCNKEVKIRRYEFLRASGYCPSHAQYQEPYMWLYNRLKSSNKSRTHVDLSYEEFLSFTKIIECHYCGDPINWPMFTNPLVGGYNLDRKDPKKGYSIDNCVVSCITCNASKHTKTYDEFLKWIEISHKRFSKIYNNIHKIKERS
jgi:hypothetical protein